VKRQGRKAAPGVLWYLISLSLRYRKSVGVPSSGAVAATQHDPENG